MKSPGCWFSTRSTWFRGEEVEPYCRRFDAIAVSARNRESFSDLLCEMEERCWGEKMLRI